MRIASGASPTSLERAGLVVRHLRNYTKEPSGHQLRRFGQERVGLSDRDVYYRDVSKRRSAGALRRVKNRQFNRIRTK
jgi:hypothetical protein